MNIFKKISKAIKNIKIVKRFFISYSVLILVVISSWIFSYTTTQQLETTLSGLNKNVFPLYATINDIKNAVNDHVYFCYDYLATQDSASLTAYNSGQEKITPLIDRLQTYLTEADQEFFNVSLLKQKLNNLNQATQELISLKKNNPNDPLIQKKILTLKNLRGTFNKLLENEIDINLQTKIEASQTLIAQKIQQITFYLISVIIIIVITTILLLTFMHYNITTPVNQITAAAIKFGHGKLTKLNIDSKDELGILSNTFNKMVVDITATQKALQDELAKTKEIDKQKSEFLSIAAHQLRTPVSGLKWLLCLIASEDLGKISAKQKYLVQNGIENVDRMIRLINNFLDIAKIEQAQFQYKFEGTKIADIINDIIKGLADKLAAKKIRLSVKINNNLPLISLDRDKIKIALNNLIDNAIKYSPVNSEIEINATHAGACLHLTIQDHGYGIPLKDQKMIFTKFFRASNVLKKETNLETIGTGLGLFIVKDIITKHQGTITFKSQENKGTTFYITLPVVQKKLIQLPNAES